jgi:Tfp pilus assembly protein PilP
MQVSLPSSTSVARQATEKDVLKLRDVNLIGVYGSASSRRALVRLGNGRYQKVRVGDSLDGGQVAAIGEGELRYIKRGRNVVLRMPQG